MDSFDKQMNDDAAIADARKWIYRQYAEARQPMLDDIAKTKQDWSAWDYMTSPVQSAKMGLTAAGAAWPADDSLGRDKAYAARMKAFEAAKKAAKQGQKMPSAWTLLKSQGVLLD